jgi:hypothetical protein
MTSSCLVLNAAAGWWWADALAGYVLLVNGAKEGWAALHSQSAFSL